MEDIYEAQNYDISYRAIISKNNLKFYTNNDIIEIDNDINFDIDASSKTSLNYFASSLLSSIIHNLIKRAKERNIFIDDIEGKISLTLKNPLTLLGVRGYNEKPKISHCTVKIYLYSDIDDSELINFCNNSLDYCFIYNTLKDSININVNFIPLI